MEKLYGEFVRCIIVAVSFSCEKKNMKENICVTTQLQVNEERRLNKTMSTTQTDDIAHARKGKSLVVFNAKNIFHILQKFKIYLLLSKSVFAATLK